MLNIDPKKRISASKAIKHRWFRNLEKTLNEVEAIKDRLRFPSNERRLSMKKQYYKDENVEAENLEIFDSKFIKKLQF